MPKNIIRLLTLILAVLMLVPCIACADSNEPEESTNTDTQATEDASEAVTESPEQTLDVPEVDYNNSEYSVMSADYDAFFTHIDVEKLSGEVVNDAIYNRNRDIEDKLHIKFKSDKAKYPDLPGIVERQTKSGDGEYDLIMLICRDAYTQTLKGNLTPYSKLEYVDTDKEYYYRDINDQLTIGGKTFFAFSAESINVLSFTNCIIFNKKIANSHNIPDIYDLVDNKEWTYEKLFEYAELCTTNADGNGPIKYGEDVIGIMGDYDRINPSAWISAGCKLVTKDENDQPVFSCITDSHFIDVMQDVIAHYAMEYCYPFTAGDRKADTFMDEKAFMLSTQVGELYTIRAMETDYGVVPWPMYNQSQGRYYPRAEDGWLHCVPNTCTDFEKTSIVLQTLAYYSYKTVYDAYYSQALSAKYVRDERSVDMLKLILSSTSLDLGDVVWYADLRAPFVNQMITKKGRTDIQSSLKKYEKKASNLIKKATDYAAKE